MGLRSRLEHLDKVARLNLWRDPNVDARHAWWQWFCNEGPTAADIYRQVAAVMMPDGRTLRAPQVLTDAELEEVDVLLTRLHELADEYTAGRGETPPRTWAEGLQH